MLTLSAGPSLGPAPRAGGVIAPHSGAGASRGAQPRTGAMPQAYTTGRSYSRGGSSYGPRYPYWLAPPTQIVDCVRDPYDPINKCCPPDRVIDGRCALLPQNPLHGALGAPSMALVGLGTVVVGVLGAFLLAKRLKQRRR